MQAERAQHRFDTAREERGKSSAPAAVWIWRIDLDAPGLADSFLEGLLDTTERTRAERFVQRRHRQYYVRSHAALRLILARALRAVPHEVAIESDAMGKPRLAPASSAAGLDFSLAHSGHLALVGMTPRGRIGVDIECDPAPADYMRLAEQSYTRDEIDALRRLDRAQRARAFLGFWTRKEAYLKAIGAGLSGDLSTCRCSLSEDGCIESRVLDGDAPRSRWHGIALDDNKSAASVIVDFTPIEVVVRPFDWARAKRELTTVANAIVIGSSGVASRSLRAQSIDLHRNERYPRRMIE